MASRAATGLFDAGMIADRWIADYCAHGAQGDVLCDRAPGDTGCITAADFETVEAWIEAGTPE